MSDIDRAIEEEFAKLSPELRAAAAPLLLNTSQAAAMHKLAGYQPYRWQQEFHAAGATHSELMLMSANRVGKTMAAGAEVALHLTGRYDELSATMRYPEVLPNGAKHPNGGELIWPHGWQGRRFDHPVTVWTGSPTNETSRDIVQAELIGGTGDLLGTGWVPRRDIRDQPQMRQAGVRDVVDTFRVQHKSGGTSTCFLKTYEQGWRKWQGKVVHVVWLDEEPDDYMIFSEAQTRTLTCKGIILVTFTPLSGATELVEHFQRGGPGIYVRGATWDDAPHLDEGERTRLMASYRAHERDARTRGIPMLGEGAVFPVAEDDIRVDPFNVPAHWARIKGCDFGIDHPAAGVEIAWDRDRDVLYVVDGYRRAGETAAYHAVWFNKANKDVPVAWPHDGMNREKAGGRTLADAYRQHGVNMLSKSARYQRVPGQTEERGGAQPVEPIIDEILERMFTGRFKVFATMNGWFEEFRSYHRKDGRIVDRRDDLLKATFYAVMMKRYAVPLTTAGRHLARRSTAVPIASARL